MKTPAKAAGDENHGSLKHTQKIPSNTFMNLIDNTARFKKVKIGRAKFN